MVCVLYDGADAVVLMQVRLQGWCGGGGLHSL
jgi:hypothetical protein